MMYYFVNNTGQQQGPVSASDLPKYGVTPQTKVWKEGMANWQPAGSVAELAGIFSAPPPTPQQPLPPFVPPPPIAPSSKTVEKKGGALKYVLLGIGGFVALCIVVCVGLYFFNDGFRQSFQKGKGATKQAVAKAYVNTPSGGMLNVRSGPSTNDDILFQLPAGTIVRVFPDERSGEWMKVQYNGVAGYVSDDFLLHLGVSGEGINAFTITGQMPEKIVGDPIVVKIVMKGWDFEANKSVELAIGSISDNSFVLELPENVPASALVPISEEFRTGFNISDNNARITNYGNPTVDGYCANGIARVELKNWIEGGEWDTRLVYVDRDVNVTEKMSGTVGGTESLSFIKGWNLLFENRGAGNNPRTTIAPRAKISWFFTYKFEESYD